MKKQLKNNDTMEPVSYSIGTGKTEWGKTLASGEITIEQYLKRIDPGGTVWQDDGSYPLFNLNESKIIDYLKTFNTFKKANDYLSKVAIIYSFVEDKNGGIIPRHIGFDRLQRMIEIDTVKVRQSAFRKLEDHDLDKYYPLTYWQHVPGVGVKEKQLKNYCLVGRVIRIDNKKEKVLLKANIVFKPYKTSRRNLEEFFNYFKTVEDQKD